MNLPTVNSGHFPDSYQFISGRLFCLNGQLFEYLYKTGESKVFNPDTDNWTGALSEYLSDNKILSDQIRNGVYKWKELADIVKAYNASH